MKTKHAIAAASAAIIAGSAFYYFRSRRLNRKQAAGNKSYSKVKNSEQRIRDVMHHAKESHGSS